MSRTQGPLIERALSRILRFTFRHFYHGFAWTYDAVARAVSLGRWYSWTEAVLPFVTGLRVLELGHGTGHLLGKLSMGQGRHVVGLDESSQMAVLARQTRALEDTLVALVRGVAQRQPFEAAQFDCVVATFPTEFIFDIHTIGELQRVLRPGGRLIVLPVAWIVGRSWPDRIAAWLLAVTRQVPPAAEQMLEERLLHPLRDAGFLVGLRRLEVQSSIVLLVLASKPPASPFQDPLALQR